MEVVEQQIQVPPLFILEDQEAVVMEVVLLMELQEQQILAEVVVEAQLLMIELADLV